MRTDRVPGLVERRADEDLVDARASARYERVSVRRLIDAPGAFHRAVRGREASGLVAQAQSDVVPAWGSEALEGHLLALPHELRGRGGDRGQSLYRRAQDVLHDGHAMDERVDLRLHSSEIACGTGRALRSCWTG